MTRKKREARSKVRAIVWTEGARSDLRDIDAYIAADNPVAADRWIAKLVAAVETAARTPLAGRVVPEKRRDDLREVFVRSYRIVYRVEDKQIVVITVFEGSRSLSPLIERDE